MSSYVGLGPNSPFKYLGPNNYLSSIVTRTRAPTSADVRQPETGKLYPLGSFWLIGANPTTGTQGDFYVLTKIVANVATWDKIGNATPYTNEFPITPYVVGPVAYAGYQTIQSAINAANAAGGGMVWVQPGSYTENLTFYDDIQLSSPSEQSVTIIGVHTPPASGTLNINRVTFQSATHVFSSVVAGTTQIIVEDTTFNVTNGYSFNLPNWTSAGQIQLFNIGNFGTNDGGINNTGGCPVYVFSAGLGNGTGNTMTLSGTVVFGGAIQISCPVNLVTGANLTSINSSYTQTITCSNNSIASFNEDNFSTGASSALVQSSSGTISLANISIDSSNVNAIAGAGAGVISLGLVTFLDSSGIAGTLTVTPVTIKPFATSGNSGTAVRGTAGFDSTQFTVTNGFVSLTGGGAAVDSFLPDTGTTPVVPDASGQVSILGQTTPNTSGIRVTGGTNSLALSMYSPFVSASPFIFGSGTNAAIPGADILPLAIAQSRVGGLVYSEINNNDNTNVLSGSRLNIVVGGTSAGDPSVFWDVPSGSSFVCGIDNSDSDEWKLSVGSNLGTNDVLAITSDLASATFSVATCSNQAAVSGQNTQLGVTNTSDTADSGARLTVTCQNTRGDTYISFNPHAALTNSLFLLGQTQADVFKLNYTTAQPSLGLMDGTTFFQCTTSGVVAVPTANGTAGLVVGSTALGSNDALTVAGEGTGVGGSLQLSVRASGTSKPLVAILSGDVTVSPSIEMGVNAVTQWSFGVNASSSNAFQVWSGADLGTGSNTFQITTSGVVSLPLAGSALYVGTSSPTLPKDLNVEKSESGSDTQIEVRNSSNTASSDALVGIVVGGASGGDAYVTYNIPSVLNWSHGIDNSDSDKFKISASQTLGTTDVLVATTAGEVTMPLQPAFSAYNSTARSNETGDGTPYTVIFNTEEYDQNGDFDGTSTFTAPVTGVYHFDACVRLTNVGPSHTTGYIELNHVGVASYYADGCSPGAIRNASSQASVAISKDLLLTAGQTVVIKVAVGGSTKTVGVDNTAVDTYFNGRLVC